MTSLSTGLLGLHLLGAAISLGLVLGAGVALVRGATQQYLFWIRSIAWAAVYQLVTGVGLAVLMAYQTSVLSVCVRLAVYLVVVCGVETVLLYRLKKTEVIHAKS